MHLILVLVLVLELVLVVVLELVFVSVPGFDLAPGRNHMAERLSSWNAAGAWQARWEYTRATVQSTCSFSRLQIEQPL